MLTSLALIILIGYALASIFEKLKLPRIIGMLITGILLGPYALNLLDPSILAISADLRQMALVIILAKAGLSLNLNDLKKVGPSALLMSFVPASFELGAITVFGPLILGISYLDAAIMGSVLAAVSPAIVVPRMVRLIEEGYGSKKGIPQLILAGSSLDDVYVIVLFSTFTDMAQGGSIQWMDFANIPISILSGILIGAGVGWLTTFFFAWCSQHHQPIRNTMKTILILGLAFMLLGIQDALDGTLAMSGLVGIIAMACMIRKQSRLEAADRLSEKFGKLWIFAEVLLFVLVGAAVNIQYTLHAGAGAILLLFVGLFFRGIGVYLCLLKTKFTFKEKLFCIFAYIPKATVQAAIGSIPLSLGLACGNIVLSVAVLAILISAPLGAILIDKSYPRLLKKQVETKTSKNGS